MSDEQVILLDEYWTELKLFGSATPPQGLDGGLAQVATRIQERAQLPEPSADMMDRLHRRLVHHVQAPANSREENVRTRSLAVLGQLVSGVRVGLLFQHAVVAVLFAFGVLCAGTPEAQHQTRLSVDFLMRTTSPGYKHTYPPLVPHLRLGAERPPGSTARIVYILGDSDPMSVVGNSDGRAGIWMVTPSTDSASGSSDRTVRIWTVSSSSTFARGEKAWSEFRPGEAMLTGRETLYFERGTYGHVPVWRVTNRLGRPLISGGTSNLATVPLAPHLGDDSVELISVDLANPRVTLFDARRHLLQVELIRLRLLLAGTLDCGYALRP
jgi:hypothetical protein